MKIFPILFLGMLLAGCNADDHPSETAPDAIRQYYFDYMNYPNGILPQSDNLVKIDYDADFKIIKRTGSYSAFDPASGFSYIFTDQLFDELSYSGNEILIEQKTSSAFAIAKFERKLFLDGLNRIYKKAVYREFDFPSRDTTYYHYSTAGKLTESNKGAADQYHEVAKFYYNPINNLDSIVTRKYYQTNLQSKTVEVFSDYDAADNPLKNLVLFEETFYRSLSRTNFRKYEIKNYDADNNPTGYSFKNFALIYDASGKVKFDTY